MDSGFPPSCLGCQGSLRDKKASEGGSSSWVKLPPAHLPNTDYLRMSENHLCWRRWVGLPHASLFNQEERHGQGSGRIWRPATQKCFWAHIYAQIVRPNGKGKTTSSGRHGVVVVMPVVVVCHVPLAGCQGQMLLHTMFEAGTYGLMVSPPNLPGNPGSLPPPGLA